LRLTGTNPGAQPVFFPPFVVAAGLLTGITLAANLRLPQELQHLGIGSITALALLVYPGTLTHYSVALVIPVFLAWSVRERLWGGTPAVICTAAMAYGLVWARLEFLANLAVWAAVVAMTTSVRASLEKPSAPK
jgi:hypothetical protein